MIKTRIASGAALFTFGLAALGGTVVAVAAPAYAAPGASGSTSTSGTRSPSGTTTTSGTTSRSGTTSTASSGQQSGVAAPTSTIGNGRQPGSASPASTVANTSSPQTAGSAEVSQAVAGMFGARGQEYQAMSAQAAAFHDQFVQCLTVCN